MMDDTDAQRNERITDEILADAYGPEEQALGWYYYLEEKMTFPLQARCTEERTISPLRKGEEVLVVDLPDEYDCMCEMLVRIEWMDREFGVPLTQLEMIDADSDTERAVADWHYWFGDGGRLC
ncbi:calcium-binding protein [Haladaptatus sp. NG-WS-4]